MDLVDRLNATAYLGREFLTWLWYTSDVQEGLVSLVEGEPAVEVWLTDRITLSGAGEGAEKVSVTTEDPAICREARTALAQGKKVEQARVRIVAGQREWTFSVKGETLALSSIKIPALLTKEEDDKLRERFMLMDQMEDMLEKLFRAFVRVRADAALWEAERAGIRDWIAAGPV